MLNINKLIVFLLLFIGWLNAQTSFQVNKFLLNGDENFSTVPVAIGDLNNDHLDDVAILHKGRFLKVYYQTYPGNKFISRNYGSVGLNGQVAIAIADLDNMGPKELLVGGFYDGIKCYKSFDGSINTYLKYFQTDFDFFTQNIAMADINGDQFIDFIVNDDDDFPKLYLNNTNGTFIFNDTILNMRLEGGGDSGNYGGIWTDFDSDGDLDYYISKCRIGVDDPEDPRRINLLFQNNGEGGFKEKAQVYGLASGEQSWVSDFSDLDNDGDKDVILINHTGSNKLYRNNGNGTYEDMTSGSVFDDEFGGIQLITRDFDNNGFKDILVSGSESKIYWNYGGFDFTVASPFGASQASSIAVGDLNYDGFWDIYAGFAPDIVSENPYIEDGVFLNNGNENHYLKITLQGETGNFLGIGSEVYLYGAWGIQQYEIRVGDGYGITNSTDVVFGMGTMNEIDSLVIRWPDKQRKKYEGFIVDNHYQLFENGDKIIIPVINTPGPRLVCNNDSLLLEVTGEIEEMTWDNYGKKDQLFVKERGIYGGVISLDGHDVRIPSIYIEEVAGLQYSEIIDLSQKAFYCSGDELSITTNPEYPFKWSNQSKDPITEFNAFEEIFYKYEVCDTLLQSETLIPGLFSPISPERAVFNVEANMDVDIFLEGERISWYKDSMSVDKIFEGNTLKLEHVQNDTSFFVTNTQTLSQYDSVGLKAPLGEIAYAPDNINGRITFEVKNYNTILKSVTCYTDFPGKRKIQLKDFWQDILDEKSVFIDSPYTVIDLNFELEKGDFYSLTTDFGENQKNFGVNSPLLHREAAPLSGILPQLSELGNVNLHPHTEYYYFYDWILEDADISCESERSKIEVIVDYSSGILEIENFVNIFPNPFFDHLMVNNKSDKRLHGALLNINGQLIEAFEIQSGEMVRVGHHISAGTYFLRFINGNQTEIKKIVKQ